MAKFHLTGKAVEDLSGIWKYTVDTWSELQADRYYEMLIASCDKIAGNPTLFGRKYKEIAGNLYGFKVNKHIIFYRILGDEEVEIIRILHECMDLKSKLEA